MAYTLIIRPKTGAFLKDYDTMGKMDPFIRITIGSEVLQTETAQNQGKNPVWKTPLNFKLTTAHYNQPDMVAILFEAFDEDVTTNEFIGKATVKLSQIRSKPNESTTIELFDNRNKPVGTIDVQFEVVQPTKVAGQEKVVRKAIGTIVVKPTQGKLDVGVIDQQELYLVFTHGDTAYQTGVSEGPGRKPAFRDIISFPQYEGEDMTVKCFDNDPERNEQIGEGGIPITTLVRRGDIHVLTIPLTSSNSKKVGELNVEIEFFPDIFNNPVKVYPTVGIKKTQNICKKIKYNNPDKFKKNLRVRTENKDLVFVKTESLTINPGEQGEIRFKIFAPTNTKFPEEKCRVDIVVEDSNIIEESLLFKIRAI